MMSFIPLAEFSVRALRMVARARVVAIAAIAFGVAAVSGQSAFASPITLGTASNYGVLLGADNTLLLDDNFHLTGNLGFGNNDTFNRAGSGDTVAGNEYHDTNLTLQDSNTVSVSGSIVTQSMTSIISAAASASTNAAALTATAGLTDQGGSINLNNSSVTIKALTNLSENVLNISALSLTNSTLTFDDNGHTGAKFIINVTGGFSVSSSGSNKSLIKGVNGASGSDIIFNIEGTGSTVSITGNSSNQIIGTILAPARNVTVGGGGTLTGALIAGVNNAGTNYTAKSQSTGYNITSLGFTPRSVSTPEPSSIALFGAGVGVLIAIRRRLRPARR